VAAAGSHFAAGLESGALDRLAVDRIHIDHRDFGGPGRDSQALCHAAQYRRREGIEQENRQAVAILEDL
jgi:hypothetical protein